ncbi:MAG: cell division protein FtsZ [Calditrichaeota bacterium]|nr:MAG: cell division protein FtsZ [Calditrichota bacterium]
MSTEKHKFDFAEDFLGYAKIKVVGVGGGGGNALNRMIEAKLKGVEFVATNTDAQVLDQNRAETKVQIGGEITGGLGAGANPEVGKKAVEESRKELSEAIGDPNLVFITAGMGGGTGTGAAPAVAEIAKAAGALTVAIVTKPFRFEGKKRIDRANEGLNDLRAKVDTLITIPNERLLEIVDRKTSLTDAFATADEVLYQATKGISDLITIPGLINCDFADVRTVMLERGDAIMGTGYGKGEEKAIDAAQAAISSPLLENISISGAKGVLINVTGGEDMALFDVNTATSLIYEAAGDDANIIFGAVIDPTMNDQMRVTVIATGFNNDDEPVKVVEEKIEEHRPAQPISLFDNQIITPQPKPQPETPKVAEPEPIQQKEVVQSSTEKPLYRHPFQQFHAKQPQEQEIVKPDFVQETPLLHEDEIDEYQQALENMQLNQEKIKANHAPVINRAKVHLDQQYYSQEQESQYENSNGGRNRVPLFDTDDLSKPAFLRRKNDD